MVGLYPDVPGPKMELDLDGSGGFYISTGGILTVLTQAQIQSLTNESSDGMSGLVNGGAWYGYIFPELRDVVGYYVQADTGTTAGNPCTARNLSYSLNSTNGQDGTWTIVAASFPFNGGWREGINSLSIPGIKALRVQHAQTSGAASGNAAMRSFTIYGGPASGHAMDRLRLWHPTLDQELGGAGFDFGDFGRGGTITKVFRVKNNSSSLTANSIVLSRGVLTDTSPAVLDMITLSQGGAFEVTQNIGALAPGEISGLCTLRIASPSNTVLGLWRQRLIVTAGSWS